MTTFKRSKVDIKTEKEAIKNDAAFASFAKPQITSLESNVKREIQDFEYPSFKKAHEMSYDERKKIYGPLSKTDHERTDRAQRDRRFSLNPLLKEPLSIEQEEQRIIEEKVRVRIQALSAEAMAQAAAEGYGAGLKKGRDEAYEQFRVETAERLKRFESTIEEIESAKQTIFRANEKYLLSLIFEVAQAVVLRELSSDKDYITRLATSIIESIGIKDNVKIKLNPKDLESVEILKLDLKQRISDLKNVIIESSNEIQMGGCHVETQHNFVDASVETQLSQLKSAILGQASG